MSRFGKWCVAIIICGSGLAAQSQVTVISGQVNYNGYSVPFAPIRVCAVTSTGTPCVPVSGLFYDYNLSSVAPNPGSADANGNYTFFAANLPLPSFYTVQVTPAPGVQPWTYVVNGGSGISLPVLPSQGGTGLDTSMLTGCPSLASGVWTISVANCSMGGVGIFTTLTAKNLTSIGPRYDVTQFGAAGTGYSTTGTVNVGTNPNLMTVASNAGFLAGQMYVIPGAGVAGANLLITVSGVVGSSISFTPAASTSVTNVTINDTLGVQAAFNACWANGTGVMPYGGIVQFPGNHTYWTTATINAYDACRIAATGTGTIPGGDAQSPPNIVYHGTGDGVTASITGFTEAANSLPYYPVFSPHPSGSTAAPKFNSIVTFNTSAANPYSIGQWVYVNGFTQTPQGKFFNQFVSQVVDIGANSFTCVIPYGNSGYGTFTDTATATSTSVVIATDSLSRYEDSVDGIQITFAGVGIYKADRVDTGTYFHGIRLEAQNYFGIYFPGGGSGINFDRGWRIEGAGVAGLYWKGSGWFSMETGQFSTSPAHKGGGIMLDNSTGLGGPSVSLRNMGFEIGNDYSAGLGAIMLNDYPATVQPGQFQINMVGVQVIADSGIVGHYTPSIVMSPPNDQALNLSLHNTYMSSSTTNPRWVGIPALARQDMLLNTSTSGNGAFIPSLTYSPPFLTTGGSNAARFGTAATELIGDTVLAQTYQYGVRSSTLLYTDTAFTGIPNATTLYTGQVIAPPAYWNSASTGNGKRYALNVVYQSGTTGTLNGGSTTCISQWTTNGFSVTNNVATVFGTGFAVQTGASIKLFTTDGVLPQNSARVVTSSSSTQFTFAFTNADVPFTADTGNVNAFQYYICSSATDLSVGQAAVATGDATFYIGAIDATNSSAVYVSTGAYQNPAHSTPVALNFVAPTLGLEIQMPTKSAASPTTLAWSRGDFEQDSSAGAANHGCGWVNIGAGTPGTWVALPCANATGTINASQIVDTPSTAPECPNGTGGSLTTVGCATGGSGAPTNTPAWLQYLGNGSNGPFTCTSGTCTRAGGFWNYTTYNVSVGATVNYQDDATIYVQGACTINGTVQSALTFAKIPNGGGGSGGGGGGGTLAGTAGDGVGIFPAAGYSGTNGGQIGGTLGGAGGGTGGAGTDLLSSAPAWSGLLNSGFMAGYFWNGGYGGNGGSTGPNGGFEGSGIILVCGSITGTGTISTNGQVGGNSTGNNVGAAGGGGAGPLIISSQTPETFGLTLTATGGAGGTCGAFTGCGAGGKGGDGPIATFSGW